MEITYNIHKTKVKPQLNIETTFVKVLNSLLSLFYQITYLKLEHRLQLHFLYIAIDYTGVPSKNFNKGF